MSWFYLFTTLLFYPSLFPLPPFSASFFLLPFPILPYNFSVSFFANTSVTQVYCSYGRFVLVLLSILLGKPQKKSYFFSGPTTKRGARPPRKKELFKNFFFICSRWKIEYILFKTTCRNIDFSVLAYCV